MKTHRPADKRGPFRPGSRPGLPSCTSDSRAWRPLAAATLLAVLTACGGGSENKPMFDGATRFVQQIPAADSATVPVRALAATGLVDVETVLDWAEYTYPALFAKGSVSFQLPYDGVVYTVRMYPYVGGVRYLGITASGAIYGLGDFTGGQLQGFGNIADYRAQVQADECKVYPGRCTGSNEPVGALNICVPSAQAALVPGNRLTARYVTVGSSTDDYTTTTVVDGPTTFDGKAAIGSTQTIAGTQNGGSVAFSVKILSYHLARADGFMATLGVQSSFTTGGLGYTTRTTYVPADVNSEFGIAVGGSYTKPLTETSTTTPGGGPSTTTSQTTYKFEAIETVTVQGKSYNTCRYVETSADTTRKTWYIVGKGVPARIESTTSPVTSISAPTTTVQELVSGDINGAPL